MKHTIILRPSPAAPGGGASDVYLLAAWQRQIGEMVAEGDALAVLRQAPDGPDVPVMSPVFGILSRKIVLPGEAIEVGEPLAVFSGVPEPLHEETPDARFRARPPYVPGGPEEVVALSPTQQAIARHMARSAQDAPHVYAVVAVDVTDTLRMAARIESGLLPFIVSATASALTRFPDLNAERAAGGEQVRRKRYVNIGIVLSDAAAPLTVRVVRDADRKSVRAIAREIDEWRRGQAHGGALPAEAMRGATFTITQTATARFRTPILHQPQVGHLCLGAVERIPVALGGDDSIAVRAVVHLCLASDARVVSDASTDGFLADVRLNLEEARFLFAA